MAFGDLLLLDTHIWIWAVHGENWRVGRDIPAAVTGAVAAGQVRISAFSVFEAAYAMARGRVPIRSSIDEWLEVAVATFGGQVQPIDRAAAEESVRLPGWVHGDPGDRLLIATARLLGARLVTVDHRILRYGAAGHVDVLDARP